jgi:arylsulfatase
MHGIRLKMRGTGKSTKQFQDDGAQSALEYLRNKNIGSNEFLFMNLMEAHAPYTPPQKYRNVNIDERPGLLQTVTGNTSTDNKKVKRAYEDCVSYLSDIYEEIFEELKQDFDYIITVADHGEMFGENGVWAHTHGVYPELTHVPLTIYNNDLEGVSEKPVSILDVHRTILEIADIESESRGQNLLADFDESNKLTEYMGLSREDIDNLLNKNVSKHTVNRYDSEFRGIVSNQGDYGYETVDGDQALNSTLKKELNEHINSMDIRDVNEEPEEEISSEVEQQLEELGYA